MKRIDDSKGHEGHKQKEETMSEEFNPIAYLAISHNSGAVQPWSVHKVNSYGDFYEGRYFSDFWGLVAGLGRLKDDLPRVELRSSRDARAVMSDKEFNLLYA